MKRFAKPLIVSLVSRDTQPKTLGPSVGCADLGAFFLFLEISRGRRRNESVYGCVVHRKRTAAAQTADPQDTTLRQEDRASGDLR